MQPIDEELKKNTDIWYARYVDDILILAPDGYARLIANDIIKSLQSFNLEAYPLAANNSKSKVAPLTESFKFLGYEVNNGKLTIRQESILKFESSLASIFTSCKHKRQKASNDDQKQKSVEFCEWLLNLRITGCIFDGKRRGWVFYFSQITDTSC